MFGSRYALDRRSLHHAFRRHSRAPEMIRKEGAMKAVTHTAETGAAAFGFGFLKGRYGAVDVLGVPMDLAAGVLLQAASYMKMVPAHEHMRALGDGAIASYLTTIGAGMGAKMRDKKGGLAPVYMQGPTPHAPMFQKATWAGDSIFAGESLREEELTAMAQAVR